MSSLRTLTKVLGGAALAFLTFSIAHVIRDRNRKKKNQILPPKEGDDDDRTETTSNTAPTPSPSPSAMTNPTLSAPSSSSAATVPKKVPTLLSRFHIASKQATAIPNVSQSDQLRLYGLYKQATVGDAVEDDGPSIPSSLLNPIASIKFQAWKSHSGTTTEQAMTRYIDLVEAILNGDSKGGNNNNNDDDDDDDDQDGTDDDLLDAIWGNAGSMGMQQSSLVHDQEMDDDYNASSNGTSHGRFALHMAARDDRPKELRTLLAGSSSSSSSNVDPNMLDDSGQTALHLAADRGHPDCLRVLLDADANVNAADADGISVLQAAVITGNVEICRMLLERGADPDQADRDGDTPRTCAENEAAEIKELFKAYPATGDREPVASSSDSVTAATQDDIRKLDSVTIDISDEDDGDM